MKIHYLLQNFDFLMVIIAWEPFHDASCDGLRMVLLRMCHGRDSGVETSFLLESKVCPQLARSNEVRFGARNVSHQCQLKILEFISYRTSRFFFVFQVLVSQQVHLSLLLFWHLDFFFHGIQQFRCITKIYFEAGRGPAQHPRASCDFVKITFALAALLTGLLNFAVVPSWSRFCFFKTMDFFCPRGY